MRKRRPFGVCGEGVGRHLQCDVPVEGRISGLIDLSHTPLANAGSDVVVAESGADLERHELWGLDRHHSIYGWVMAPADARNCLCAAHERFVRALFRRGGVRGARFSGRGSRGVHTLPRCQCNVLHAPHVNADLGESIV